jgi:hypothetical protein
MNVEIGAEAALFPEKEYINGIAIAVVRPLSVSFFIEKEPHKQLRMKRKRKGER